MFVVLTEAIFASLENLPGFMLAHFIVSWYSTMF